VTITTFPVEIKPPNFTLPAFNAKPLNLAANFSLPASLQALAKIANFTAVDLDLPELNFTLPSLPTLQLDASHPGLALLSSLPNVLKFDRPVTNMTVPDVLAQWLAATVSKATLPRIVVPAAKVNALKAFIPGFTAPSVVMPTYLSSLLSKVREGLALLQTWLTVSKVVLSGAWQSARVTKPCHCVSSQCPLRPPRFCAALQDRNCHPSLRHLQCLAGGWLLLIQTAAAALYRRCRPALSCLPSASLPRRCPACRCCCPTSPACPALWCQLNCPR
jgi:hypothetical protein